MQQGKEFFISVGEAGINFSRAMSYILRGKINIDETAFQIYKAGVGSLFIVIITSMFIGLAISVQLGKELSERFGAEHFVGGLIAMATVRELAPVITAIVVAGRVGAAISAEIGSMKSSEQIDALEVLGVSPIKYLLVPRLIAAAITTPFLTTVAAFISILAGMVLTKASVNLDYGIFLDSVRETIEERDIFVMLLKSVVFGALISILATTLGLQVKGGAEAVGNATTKTVVLSIIFIFTFNYIITSFFFGV